MQQAKNAKNHDQPPPMVSNMEASVEVSGQPSMESKKYGLILNGNAISGEDFTAKNQGVADHTGQESEIDQEA